MIVKTNCDDSSDFINQEEISQSTSHHLAILIRLLIGHGLLILAVVLYLSTDE
jgi:hypothetical protein